MCIDFKVFNVLAEMVPSYTISMVQKLAFVSPSGDITIEGKYFEGNMTRFATLALSPKTFDYAIRQVFKVICFLLFPPPSASPFHHCSDDVLKIQYLTKNL